MSDVRAFRLAYDGRRFHGFQRQPDVPTVEGRLFDALRSLDAFADGAGDGERNRPPDYAAAGRTDAGVSAVAQTVAFRAPAWLTPRALNSELPGGIRAWASADAPPAFHATHDAARREYTYHLYAPREATPAARGVDDDRAREALAALAGEHDFHNLTPDERGTVRELSTALQREGPFLLLRIAASGFARQLVRRLVTLVRAVATGDADIARVDRVLSAEPLTGPAGIGPAPPEPLVLTDVDYPGLAFAVDAEAVASAREAFDERRVEALAASRVAETVRDGLGE